MAVGWKLKTNLPEHSVAVESKLVTEMFLVLKHWGLQGLQGLWIYDVYVTVQLFLSLGLLRPRMTGNFWRRAIGGKLYVPLELENFLSWVYKSCNSDESFWKKVSFLFFGGFVVLLLGRGILSSKGHFYPFLDFREILEGLGGFNQNFWTLLGHFNEHRTCTVLWIL